MHSRALFEMIGVEGLKNSVHYLIKIQGSTTLLAILEVYFLLLQNLPLQRAKKCQIKVH